MKLQDISAIYQSVYETGSQVGNLRSRPGEKYSWLHYGSEGGQSQDS